MKAFQRSRFFWLALAGLVLPLALLFHSSFDPTQVLFSNDGPLGAIVAQADTAHKVFFGHWEPLNWIGYPLPNASPDITMALFFLSSGPVLFAKFYAPLALLILGLCAFRFFRQLGFGTQAAFLGGLAALLNSNTFSNACWGLPTRALTLASIFLALTAVESSFGKKPLAKAILAGFAVGLAIMEGFDVAAFFSLYVAAYAIFRSFQQTKLNGGKLTIAIVRVGLVTCAAAIMAAATLSTLIGTQIKGVTGMGQDAEAKQEHWDAATMWSLPKLETFRVVIPGLFGYRMDTPNGGNYWGKVGQQPGWEETHKGQPRHSGSGEYAGVPVVLIACWAFFRSLRSKNSPFSPLEHKAIWFWSGAALISLLLAFGRFAPFYQIIYHLPYFSTIRNPIKFMHPFQMSILILFAYGVHGLWRNYVEKASSQTGSPVTRVRALWKSVDPFEKRWSIGSTLALAAAALGFLIYYSSRSELLRHLESAGFPTELGQSIFAFSSGEIAWFIFFLALSTALVLAICAGLFSGARSKWVVILLGIVIFADLARANLPWIVYFNYKEKYALNPVLDELRQKSYEHRVIGRVLPTANAYFATDTNFIAVYNEWLQHQFQYYKIQSLDIVQMPRMAELDSEFLNRFYPGGATESPKFTRLWELSNTRYLLGVKGYIDALNQQIDPVKKRFRIRTTFDFAPRDPQKSQVTVEDLTTVIKPEGQYAVFEFTGALPRAKLYTQWEVSTNGQATLQKLIDPAFEPSEKVLVDQALPSPDGTNSGTAAITHYEPTEVDVQAHASSGSVLLLNDRYDPDWQVAVDGKRETLLRCNFAMRGVFLSPGDHEIKFRFKPDRGPVYTSFAAILIGLVLLLWVSLTGRRSEVPTQT